MKKVMTQLEKFQNKCRNNRDFQKAISNYVKAHNLILPDNATYDFGIDYFDVRVNDMRGLSK